MAISPVYRLCIFEIIIVATAFQVDPSTLRAHSLEADEPVLSLFQVGHTLDDGGSAPQRLQADVGFDTVTFHKWDAAGNLSALAVPQAVETDAHNNLYRNLLCMNAVFIFIALVCLYNSWGVRGGFTSHEGFLGMTKVSQLVIFFAYVSLACTHTFTQHKSGATGYSLVAATALIYMFKVIVSFCMYLSRGYGTFTDVFKSAEELGQPRFGRIPAIFLLAFPAVSLAFYDLLSFMTLAKMDPVTYQILRSGRIVLVAGLWQPALGRTLSRMQMAALLFFMAASMSKGIDQVGGNGGFNMETLVSTGIVLILIQITVSVFANVASEVCLKQIPLHTDLINFASYSTGFIALLGFLVYREGASGLYEQAFAPAAWALLFGDVWMCASIGTLVVFGIITAYFLRDLSNILKELSFGFVIIITAIVESATTTTASTPLGRSAVILTVLAIMVYNADPLATAPKPETSKSPAPENKC